MYNKYKEMYTNRRELEEHCYSIGVPVDKYIELIHENFEDEDVFAEHMSELEKRVTNEEID